MAEVTLAKALKLKNRIIGRISSVTNDVRSYNSVTKGQEGQVDVMGAFEARKILVTQLIGLKTTLSEAAGPIRERLFKIQELKGELSFIQSISTNEGKQPHRYQAQEVEYVAVLKKADLDQQVRKIEIEIDRLQDEIDDYNAKTTVQVSDKLIELAQAV